VDKCIFGTTSLMNRKEENNITINTQKIYDITHNMLNRTTLKQHYPKQEINNFKQEINITLNKPNGYMYFVMFT
jgi:hypothetical protein